MALAVGQEWAYSGSNSELKIQNIKGLSAPGQPFYILYSIF
jgi:hypothetical protein